MVFTVPGFAIVTTPPQLHMQVDTLSSEGWLPSSTVGVPGTHGVMVAGMHGIGVSTPLAAAVANRHRDQGREPVGLD